MPQGRKETQESWKGTSQGPRRKKKTQRGSIWDISHRGALIQGIGYKGAERKCCRSIRENFCRVIGKEKRAGATPRYENLATPPRLHLASEYLASWIFSCSDMGSWNKRDSISMPLWSLLVIQEYSWCLREAGNSLDPTSELHQGLPLTEATENIWRVNFQSLNLSECRRKSTG